MDCFKTKNNAKNRQNGGSKKRLWFFSKRH